MERSKLIPRIRLSLAVLAGTLVLGGWNRGGTAENLGEAPELGTASRDVVASFKLPAFHNEAGGELSTALGKLQLGKRAELLGLNARSATEAWLGADATLQAARKRLAGLEPADGRVFTGARASELNALIRDPSVSAIRINSPSLQIDETVTIRRAKLWLDLGKAELRVDGDKSRFLLRVENGSDVTVSGGAYVGGQYGALVDGGYNVTLRDARFDGLSHGGVVFNNTEHAILAYTSLRRMGGAPVLLHGDTVASVLIDNEIVGNLGSSNWHGGIVISDRNGAVADNPEVILNADRYGVVEQPINTRLHPPLRNVLAGNRIAENASSGIYSDGGVGSVIFHNTVEGNAKEGICLDNGSTANVVAMNLVRLNGKRWGKSDADLKLDFVGALGRLRDGSSPAKTPGISMDNSLYNIIFANQIERNYGGGLKLVRTGFFNILGLNTILDNNEGANEHFHFFGVELGSAKADVPVSDLDFTACRGNIVFGNIIRGTHYSGIFFGLDSTQNDVFDNAIFGATNWALEQVRVQQNSSLNNLTNLPSRNIDAGIDANLLKSTKGRDD